jgi:CubicO group peptidase (beta-lactamase class C family)
VTIHDLLTHTSGMVQNAPWQPDDTLASYVPRLATVPLRFQPGTDWAYSGLAGPEVLARVVEIASGQAFDVFLRQRILGPLGMKDTAYVPSDSQRPRLVTLYKSTPEGLQRYDSLERYSSRTFYSGSVGLVSTAEDYVRFAQMLANGGELDGTRLLKQETVQLMSSNQVGTLFSGKLRFPQRGFGFGYLMAVLQDSKAAGWDLPDGSFGWFGAYGTQTWINRKEQLVTLLMIQNEGPFYPVQRDFERAVVGARLAPGAAH